MPNSHVMQHLTKLATIIKSTDLKHLKENGIYCKETFEDEYGLKWVATGNA